MIYIDIIQMMTQNLQRLKIKKIGIKYLNSIHRKQLIWNCFGYLSYQSLMIKDVLKFMLHVKKKTKNYENGI